MRSFLLLFSFYFLQVFKTSVSRILFLFFLIYFTRNFVSRFSTKKSIVDVILVWVWNEISWELPALFAKYAIFRLQPSSQVTGTLLFYTVRIGNHYPQNECVEGDGKFLLHMKGLKESGGCFWYGTFEKIQVIFMVWLVYTLFFI